MKTPPAHALLDHAIRKCKLKDDKRLAGALGADPSVISHIRHEVYGISDFLILRLHELTGDPIAELRVLGGLPPTILGRKFDRMPVAPAIIDRVSKLPRYYMGDDGKLHPGAVSTNGFIRLNEVLALLEKP